MRVRAKRVTPVSMQRVDAEVGASLINLPATSDDRGVWAVEAVINVLDAHDVETGYRQDIARGRWVPFTGPGAPADVRASEAAVIDYLRAQGFAGAAYSAFMDPLVERSYSVTKNWIRSGKMAVECRRRHRPVTGVQGASEDDLHDLAVDTVLDAARLFHDVALVGGVWTPGRAPLASFFLGACINVYPLIHRRWLRTRDQRRQVLAEVQLRQPSHASFDNETVMRMMISDGIRHLPERQRYAILMSAAGYSHTAIAEAIGGSGKSVERLISRARRQLRDALELRDGGSYD